MANKYFEMIGEYCDVKSTVGDKAIYYIEDGLGFAEMLEPNGEWGTWTCSSLTQFEELCELNGVK